MTRLFLTAIVALTATSAYAGSTGPADGYLASLRDEFKRPYIDHKALVELVHAADGARVVVIAVDPDTGTYRIAFAGGGCGGCHEHSAGDHGPNPHGDKYSEKGGMFGTGLDANHFMRDIGMALMGTGDTHAPSDDNDGDPGHTADTTTGNTGLSGGRQGYGIGN